MCQIGSNLTKLSLGVSSVVAVQVQLLVPEFTVTHFRATFCDSF